jgi:hypothetical protein
MADKEFKFHLKTTGDPKGAKEVEDAIDDVADATAALTTTSGGTVTLDREFKETALDARNLQEAVEDLTVATKDLAAVPALPIQPAEIKQAERSISDLTSELGRLQRELEAVPVGGSAFQTLAGQVAAAQGRLNAAQQQAKALGSTVGRGGNAGMAVLEFSRAFEDAQYGIRGVLNNIPGLIAMLGGGAGLAGVISLAAVAATQLWERLKAPENAEEEFESVEDTLKALADQFKALNARRKEGERSSLADIFDGESKSMGHATEKVLANIEALKERERVAGEIDKLQTEAAIADIGRRVASGDLEENKASDLVFGLREQLAAREIDRLKRIGGLDESAFEAKEEAARNELEIRLREQELIAAQLRELEARKKAFDDAAREYVKAQQAGGRSEGFAFEPFIDVARRRDVLDRVEPQLGLSGIPDDTEISQEARKKVEERREELSSELKALESEFFGAGSAVKSARDAVRAAKNALEIATQRINDDALGVDQLEAARRDARTREQADEKFAGAQDSTQSAVGELAGQLGNDGELGAVAAQLRSFLADKVLTADELVKTQVLLGQYFGKVANLGSNQNEAIREAMSRIDELERQTRALRNNQRNPNP